MTIDSWVCSSIPCNSDCGSGSMNFNRCFFTNLGQGHKLDGWIIFNEFNLALRATADNYLLRVTMIIDMSSDVNKTKFLRPRPK